MKVGMTVVLFFILAGKVSANCEMPRGEKLTVACTTGCDFIYRFRLNLAALRMGYRLNIINLQKEISPIESLGKIDALFVPGGADIDPEFYLPHVSHELQDYTRQNLHLVKFTQEGRNRDAFEYDILSRYNKEDQYKDLPLLGICRGMQMMTVAQGIPLWLDIKTEVGIKNRLNRFDRIFIKPEESLMQSIYKNNDFLGFKLHHQGLRLPYYEENKDQYPDVRVSALSNNSKIVESVEYLHRPALGVQYHPEKSFSTASFPIYRWFLTKACEYSNSDKDRL